MEIFQSSETEPTHAAKLYLSSVTSVNPAVCQSETSPSMTNWLTLSPPKSAATSPTAFQPSTVSAETSITPRDRTIANERTIAKIFFIEKTSNSFFAGRITCPIWYVYSTPII